MVRGGEPVGFTRHWALMRAWHMVANVRQLGSARARRLLVGGVAALVITGARHEGGGAGRRARVDARVDVSRVPLQHAVEDAVGGLRPRPRARLWVVRRGGGAGRRGRPAHGRAVHAAVWGSGVGAPANRGLLPRLRPLRFCAAVGRHLLLLLLLLLLEVVVVVVEVVVRAGWSVRRCWVCVVGGRGRQQRRHGGRCGVALLVLVLRRGGGGGAARVRRRVQRGGVAAVGREGAGGRSGARGRGAVAVAVASVGAAR